MFGKYEDGRYDPGRYVLDADGAPVREPDLLVWGAWMETADRHVALDERGGVRVSTVFLGLDHNWAPAGPPILWETMIFGGPHDQYQDRYTSRADALVGHAHAKMLAFEDVSLALDPPHDDA